MEDLKAIVGDKDYFVVTSNGECHFELCGFDPDKIYEIEGNWLTMQCARPCHDTRYVTINLGEVYIADNINEKSFGLDGRLDELLPALRKACGI